MAVISKNEKQLMEHFDSIVHRYASKEPQHLDLCRKPELKILEILGKNGRLTMKEVADRATLSMSTMTTIMDGLVDKALVSRQRSEDDRRLVWVDLTPEGEKIYSEILDFHLRMVRGMLNALSKNEQNILIGLFRKIVDTVETEKR